MAANRLGITLRLEYETDETVSEAFHRFENLKAWIKEKTFWDFNLTVVTLVDRQPIPGEPTEMHSETER